MNLTCVVAGPLCVLPDAGRFDPVILRARLLGGGVFLLEEAPRSAASTPLCSSCTTTQTHREKGECWPTMQQHWCASTYRLTHPGLLPLQGPQAPSALVPAMGRITNYDAPCNICSSGQSVTRVSPRAKVLITACSASAAAPSDATSGNGEVCKHMQWLDETNVHSPNNISDPHVAIKLITSA